MKKIKIIEDLKRQCFVCNKEHMLMAGQMAVVRLFNKEHKGTQHIFERRAPLHCWLANNKRQVNKLYNDKEWMKIHKQSYD